MADDVARYHRQMLLPNWGEAGQRRLLASGVLIAGCGALGTMLAGTLARAGVGRLTVIDRDLVELTNLQRQILFDEEDVRAGLPKAEAARRKLAAINSQVQVTAVIDDINHTNVERFLAGGADGHNVDAIVDGLDNFETRFLLNDAAVKHGIPYVYGGAVGMVGMTFGILPHTPAGDRPWETLATGSIATPCLRCIFEEPPPAGTSPTCDTIGVLGPVVALIASVQAATALKILTGQWSTIDPALLNVDLQANTFRQVQVAGAYEQGRCPCCGQRLFEYLAGQGASATVSLCGRNAVQVMPSGTGLKMDLERIAGQLRGHGAVTVNAFMLRAEIRHGAEAYDLSLFADGRAIVKGTTDVLVAKSLYAKYVGA